MLESLPLPLLLLLLLLLLHVSSSTLPSPTFPSAGLLYCLDGRMKLEWAVAIISLCVRDIGNMSVSKGSSVVTLRCVSENRVRGEVRERERER